MFAKIITTIIILSIVLISSCDNNEPPVQPPYEPEIIVEISGDENLKYEAQGWVTQSLDKKSLYFSSTATINKNKCGLVILVNYKDSIQIGRFVFANSKTKPDTTYAIAAFEIEKDKKKTTYFSHTGEITITDVSGTKFFATFQFAASDNDSLKHITAKSGILKALH